MNKTSSRTVAHPFVAAAAVVCTTVVGSHGAAAQGLQRFSVHAEGEAATLVGSDPSRRFGWGGDVIARLGFDLIGPLSIQASVGNWWFAADNGAAGRLYTFEGGLRVAPRISRGVVGGPVVDANAGIGITGGLQRFMFDAGLGWEFAPVQFFQIGPMVRYTQVVDSAPSESAYILQFGLGITLRAPHSDPAPARTEPVGPPPDRDHDGVPDASDRCPNQPEDVDGFQDDDGCPDLDNDSDGIPDTQDRCPNQPETRNGYQDEDGCPDTPPPPAVVVAPVSPFMMHLQEIGERVFFDYGSHRLRVDAQGPLAQMCELLRANPGIMRLRVEGHADERGTPERNQELSSFRAGVVAREVIRCGFPADRVEAVGLGALRGCEESDEACHQRNRHVDFQAQEPPAGTSSSPAPVIVAPPPAPPSASVPVERDDGHEPPVAHRHRRAGRLHGPAPGEAGIAGSVDGRHVP